MANYKTGAQRYNDRMDKIMDTWRKNNGWVNNNKIKESLPLPKCEACGVYATRMDYHMRDHK